MNTNNQQELAEAFSIGQRTREMDIAKYLSAVRELKQCDELSKKMVIWQAIEAIKNRYGGHPPVHSDVVLPSGLPAWLAHSTKEVA